MSKSSITRTARAESRIYRTTEGGSTWTFRSWSPVANAWCETHGLTLARAQELRAEFINFRLACRN